MVAIKPIKDPYHCKSITIKDRMVVKASVNLTLMPQVGIPGIIFLLKHL